MDPIFEGINFFWIQIIFLDKSFEDPKKFDKKIFRLKNFFGPKFSLDLIPNLTYLSAGNNFI